MANLIKNISCVCMHCGKSSNEDSRIEINFIEKSIYWKCPDCRETNKITIEIPKNTEPLPRTRLM